MSEDNRSGDVSAASFPAQPTGWNPAAAGRPNAKSFLEISRENPYAQLSVSPLAPTSEISTLINTNLANARRKILAKGSSSADDLDEKELLRMQKIDQEIGDPRRRKAYDEKNPQNILLTVQPSASEQAWSRHRRAGLISEWVAQSLAPAPPAGYGEAVFLPTPNCLRMWAPSGVDDAVQGFLAEFERAAGEVASAVGTFPGAESSEYVARQLNLDELEALTNKEQV